ncbi:MAG: PIG-L family deacetylase [Chloroflexi bacterium]|nr:PIG-L family deacetylase [Chloroflexota bacterium]MBV9597358.1 PIG-L family deacetylase [Chloroflexota bacterium]
MWQGVQMTLVLLTVNGHPDDEVVTVGGVMARYAAEGARVIAVMATRGECGEIVAPDLDTPENRAHLGDVRTHELERGLARLGAVEHRWLGYRDSGMDGAPENADPRSFLRADPDEAAERLLVLIREVRPQVIVAPNAYGGDGHPDHIRASLIARLAFDRAGDETWAPGKLYASTDDLQRLEKLKRLLRAGNLTEVAGLGWRLARVWRPRDEALRRRVAAAQGPVTTRVDIGAYLGAKYAAMREHRTQIDPRSTRFAVTPEQRLRTNPTENFSLVRARGVNLSLPEDDLFAGLR